MSHGEVYSHQGKRLEHHLMQTTDLALNIISHFDLEITEKEKISILLHDLAKAHPQFQKHLLEHKGKFGHSAPSAALVFGLTGELLCAEVVRRHHSYLENLEEAKKFWSEWDYKENVENVMSRIPVWNGSEVIMGSIGRQVKHWKELLPSLEEWDEFLLKHVELFPMNPEAREEDWLRLRLLYSILITADRYHAAVGQRIEFPPLRIDGERVKNYIASLQGKPLASWRDQVRSEVVERARDVMAKPGIYTLTLPTGAGKTLIGLEVAMQAAERLGATGILYVLPFISLVEQNADVARELFQGVSPVREDHYLSDVETEQNASETLSARDRFLSFFRYWQEPVVITTMVKFWSVLFSPKGNDTMSLHRLSKAVVILDEPQAIPACYWEGFGKILKLLSQKLHTTFILMTATQPEIVRGAELAPRTYFFPVNRHNFHWIPDRKTIPDLFDSFDAAVFQEKSSLFVFNTHRSALLAWKELYKREMDFYFLSAWVTPSDRRLILQQIKEDEAKGKQVRLVSTQVVEAGVDLDFQFVFRDLGPFDSIIQVAGRCNRHGKREPGDVVICELYDDRQKKSYASYVYDSELLVATKSILREKFEERDCPELISAYYRKVKEITANSPLWDDIVNDRWGERHDLIKETKKGEATLVVAYDGVDKDMETISKSIDPAADIMEQLEQRRKANRRIGLHAVSVPAQMLEQWSLQVGGMIFGEGTEILREVYPGFWLVQGEGIGQIYSHQIGFIPPDFQQSGDESDET